MTDVTRAEVIKRVQAGESQRAVAEELGLSKDAVGRAVRRAAKKEAKPAASAGAGRSLDEFKRQYNKDYIVPTKIREALKALGAGWKYEPEFAKDAGVSLADLGNYRSQFADHVVPLKRDSRRVWAGTVAFADKLKGML